jgi:hypothetical protein
MAIILFAFFVYSFSMKFVFLSALLFGGFAMQAQRFFYIEPGDKAAKALTESLRQASQYVVPTVLASDFIVKSQFDFNTATNTSTITMSLEDSATFVTLFQTREEYRFGVTKNDALVLLDLAVRTLLQKNLRQIILCANDEHAAGQTHLLKASKDKT